MILVTGGAGFIGSNFVLHWLAGGRGPVVNLDKLTYAGNAENLAAAREDPRHVFVRGDIADGGTVRRLLDAHRPAAVVNFAAESHVDRSIHGPAAFVRTNIVGTYELLEAVRHYWTALPPRERESFRFLHVSSDEVYGSLETHEPAFTEARAYAPNSPYAASKAASDHLVRAYHHTWGLPTLTTNCSNNYGPRQFPEKLIPLVIVNAVHGRSLPVYGDGGNVRDWLYVADHCSALLRVLEAGRPGEVYNIGGSAERTNLQVVHALAGILDELRPDRAPHARLITHVADRPGHDRRYAMDTRKLESGTGWRPVEAFETGLRKTVAWYLDNMDWVGNVTSGEYRKWVDLNYGGR
ncbi:MAG: dTDP-glucose 4,6-dehydratase [Burkholderiales bacterium]|nr:dTDP-glucose 4,6-dehydratase [Burkholderiales bacterium]